MLIKLRTLYFVGTSGSAQTTSTYHKISVANLFSSQSTPSMPAPAVTANGILTPNTNGLLMNSSAVTKTPNVSAASIGTRNYRFDEMVLGLFRN